MERSELLEKFREDISWLGVCETEREIISHIEYAMKLLKEQPDVVRCIDCKHYDSIAQSCNSGWDGIFLPDFFCADGERRER